MFLPTLQVLAEKKIGWGHAFLKNLFQKHEIRKFPKWKFRRFRWSADLKIIHENFKFCYPRAFWKNVLEIEKSWKIFRRRKIGSIIKNSKLRIWRILHVHLTNLAQTKLQKLKFWKVENLDFWGKYPLLKVEENMEENGKSKIMYYGSFAFYANISAPWCFEKL